MNISKLLLINADFNKVNKEIVTHFNYQGGFNYKDLRDDVMIVMIEEYRVRNNSTQLNVVITRKESEGVIVEFISGGGGTGVFNVSWGSEKSFLKDSRKMILQLASREKYEVKEI